MTQNDHEGSVRPTGWRTPLGIVLVTGALAFLVVNQTYTNLFLLPWTAIPTLSLLAFGEVITAVQIRRRIRREPGTEPVDAISVARLVAFAKASVLFGAVAVGGFGGFGLALLDLLHSPHARDDALVAGGTALSGLALMGAGLFLEYACRVPKDDRENRNDG